MAGDDSPTNILGRHIETGDPISVHLAGDLIGAICPLDGRDPASLPWVGPGLVDLQVNGFMGSDLNLPTLSARSVDRLVRDLWAVGVTTFMPTLVTASETTLETNLRTIAAAIAGDAGTAGAIAGIHLEGPFISPEDGPRGAHAMEHVRAPDWSLFERWQQAAGGHIRMVTLAPEWPDAPDFIARCTSAGVIVAIGHTAARPDQIRAAVRAGARLSTHLGNGTHPVLPRHPNYIWEQLACDDLGASVIADGFHLPDAVLKTILRVKDDRAFLVSDSVALAGMPPGDYDTPVGQRVTLTPSGRLHLVSDPRLLAGSALPLVAGVAHLEYAGLATLGEAWGLASTRAAAVLGLPVQSGLAVGAAADLVVFRHDPGAVQIERVFAGGRSVHPDDGSPDRGRAR